MIRIMHGEMLLLTTDLPVSQIAAECGFGVAMGAYDAETGKTSYTFFAK